MKTWMITGASSGIGKGLAEAVLKHEDKAVLMARHIQGVSELMERYPEKVCLLNMDVTDAAQTTEVVNKAVERFGRIDVLVNNAGHGYRSAFEEGEEDEIEKLFQTNFFGPARLIRKVLPYMRQQKSGTIVNVTSIGGIRGAIGNSYYSAAKGAMELASDALCKELEPLGIRVLIVEPGAFRTGFYRSLHGTRIHIENYASTVGKMYVEKLVDYQDQPGDPIRAGEVLYELVGTGVMPEHIAFGSDAVKIITERMKERLAEVTEWSAVSQKTDFEGSTK